MTKVFAVYDAKAACYGRMIEQPTEGLAARSFADACKNQEGPLYQHSGDYSLYELGTFDPASGKMESLPEPKHIISASAVVSHIKQQNPDLPGIPEASTKTDKADLGQEAAT